MTADHFSLKEEEVTQDLLDEIDEKHCDFFNCDAAAPDAAKQYQRCDDVFENPFKKFIHFDHLLRSDLPLSDCYYIETSIQCQ